MQKLILFLALLVLAPLAGAADSPKDVQALIARGDYAGAEAQLRSVIADHPQSAKAHYVLAEVLAHEGNIGEAKAEAAKAAAIDPATRFTDPAKFKAFQRKLDEALAPPSGSRRPASALGTIDAPQAPAQAPARESGGSHLLGPLVVAAVIVLAIFLWMRRRRDAASPANGYPPVPPQGSPAPYDAYNNGGYNNGSYGNGPYPPPAQPPRSGPGMGTAVAAGLGGVAAGMLLDEALRSHREGEAPRDAGFLNTDARDSSTQAYDDLRDDPIDMGSNDNSWDDSSSGDSSSDDDSW